MAQTFTVSGDAVDHSKSITSCPVQTSNAVFHAAILHMRKFSHRP